jgi:transposase-like protein
MGEDDTVINFNFDLSDLVGGLGDLGPDDEIEIVDDDEIEIVDDDEPTSDLGSSGHDAPYMDLGDSDDDAGESDLGRLGASSSSPMGSDEPDMDFDKEDEEDTKLPLSERVRRGRQAAKNRTLTENKNLKSQLAEQTLFNAKVVHLQPFLNNRNLTKEQKQKIVEYLDRGKTVNEVKTIYTRVKAVLENAQKAKAKVGSSSRPAGAGAATLNESANAENLYEGAVLVEAERNRLMELAGIRRK